MTDDAHGKRCPICGEPMSDISSQQVRICTNGKCGWHKFWPLDEGQPPLNTSNRDTRK